MLRHPNPVPIGDMVEACWHDAQWTDADAEPRTAINTVQLTIGHLRGKIGGFHIKGQCGFGYRLVQGPGG